MEYILLLACLIITIVFLALGYDHIFVGSVPFISIPDKTLREIVDNCKISRNSTLYDLGCGDGRVLLQFAKKYSDITLIGIEKAFIPYLMAKFKTRNYPNISIQHGDITKVSYPDDSIFFLYLLPELLKQVSVLLPTNSKIISIHYQIPSKEYKRTVKLKNKSKLIDKLYLY